TTTAVGLDYRDLCDHVTRGDTLLLDDGRLRLRVDDVETSAVDCTVLQGGKLGSRKGINRLGGGLAAPALTTKDIADIDSLAGVKPDFVAVSFVSSAEDIHQTRELLGNHGLSAAIIAKIERAEVVADTDTLDHILEASFGVMVARGDLGVEVGDAQLIGIQKDLISRARKRDRVVITATQMMESMISNPLPTRAEVFDVANAVLDGTDAVMLSAETAAGKYPLDTVREMAAICAAAEAAEDLERDSDFIGQTLGRIDQSIAMGALFTAHHLGAKAIVAMTDSGSTALWMSRHRIHIPIYALTPKVATQRRMAMFRNVRPLLMDTSADRDTALDQAESHLKMRNIVQQGDLYVITCGEPMGAPGGTNMLKICRAR
uniref:pyruvate kinase n=1 Tax=Diaphorobacter nitroreducens TaxID=164759 RepID=UPI0024E225C5